MSERTVLTAIDDHVLTITLNRPERLNAWTYQMAAELRGAIQDGNDNPAVEAMVLTGAGRGFCAGADVEAVFQAQRQDDPPFRDAAATGDWVRLVRASKPLVAAINGAAIGVGLSQLMPFDRLVASTAARLSFRFVRMGVTPELASSHFLPARVGFGVASDLMLTGRTVDAAEALALGLVDEVTEPAALIETAREAARAMGANPRSAVAETKALLTSNLAEASLDAVQARENAALARSYATPEHHEAIAAFLEKRAPDYRKARTQKG
ncbi:MAG: enoyl-CoA hydratase/isomerase family protein [Gammaproteobacteria bacterium]